MRTCVGGDGRILLIGVPTILLLMYLLVLAIVVKVEGQRLTPPRQYHSSKDEDDDAEENKKRTIHPKQASVISDNEFDEANGNLTERGMYVGALCDEGNICNDRLLHVICNEGTGFCECEKKYPVQLSSLTGCGKPKKLGEQCYYKETCEYADPQSSCIQIHHNAICQCKPGYHLVSLQKPTKRHFCAEDLVEMATDFSTLAGVVSGIAVLSGLICFVLKLFNQNLYGTGRHRYGNANLAPPILFSSDADTSDPVYGSFTGSVPTILEQQRRPTAGSISRASSQRTLTSIRRPSSAPGYHSYQQSGSYHSRHSVSGSRAGSRRPSLTSVHSNNSVRSYSQRRYEREREQKEEREMQRRLAKLQQQQQEEVRAQQQKQRVVEALSAVSGGTSIVVIANGSDSVDENSGGGMQSHSTDDLLPTLEEDADTAVPIDIPLSMSEDSTSTSLHEEKPSTSKRFP